MLEANELTRHEADKVAAAVILQGIKNDKRRLEKTSKQKKIKKIDGCAASVSFTTNAEKYLGLVVFVLRKNKHDFEIQKLFEENYGC